MAGIAKEVKSFRGNQATIISSKPNGIKPQEQTTNISNAPVKTIAPIVKTEPHENIDQSAGSSRVMVRSGVAKRAKEKGLIMEQDIDGLEYSSDEEASKPTEDFEELFTMNSKKSKSEMITTNHEKIYYRPFRKDFYTVVPEIASMSDLEVAAYREELDGIKVVGKRCPRPIKAWSQCMTSNKILQLLRK